MPDTVRSVRNNNPGNLRISSDQWQGLMPRSEMTVDQASEIEFFVFKSPKYGFRAMARTIITYQDKRKAPDGSKIDTITKVIERWAPQFENNVNAYIQSVDASHPRTARDELNFHNYEDLAPLIKAMAIHEAGGWFFNDLDLDAGLQLAGVEKPVATHIASDRTSNATGVGAVVSIAAVVSSVAEQASPAVEVLHRVAEYAPIVAGVIVLVIFGAIAYFRYDDWRRARG